MLAGKVSLKKKTPFLSCTYMDINLSIPMNGLFKICHIVISLGKEGSIILVLACIQQII